MKSDAGAASDWFGINRAQFATELQQIIQHLPGAETTHGLLVNLTYLFLSKTQKQTLVRIWYEQAARHILAAVPADANELHWFSAVSSASLLQQDTKHPSELFEFLKQNKEQGETHFRNKIESYVQERAMQRFPNDSKADYAISDSIRYVTKTIIVEREHLDKIQLGLNHYHPVRVSLFTNATYLLKLLETPTDTILRKIEVLRRAVSLFNEARINHDLEMRMLSLKRMKDAEIQIAIRLFDLLLHLGAHDPLHEMFAPILQKMEQNFLQVTTDIRDLHKKNIGKSGEILRRSMLEKDQDILVEKYNQLKESNQTLLSKKESLEEETLKYRKQKISKDATDYLKQKIARLEKENSQLTDDYYYFKVKFLNIVPSDSERDQALETAWQDYLSKQNASISEGDSVYEKQSFIDPTLEQQIFQSLQAQEVDEDLLDEPSKINLAEISPVALKTLNNRLEIQNQKLDEINQGIEQQNKLIEQSISALKESRQIYFESAEFDFELEKQSLEAHCRILLKDKQRNSERFTEIQWKLEKLLEEYDGDKTDINTTLKEIESKTSSYQTRQE